MSGPEVISLISGTITIFDAILKGYRNARDADGLPLAFQEVALRLPLAQDTLRAVETQINKHDLEEETCRAMKGTVEACRDKAKSLEKIIAGVASRSATSRVEPYCVAARSLVKGHRVEKLMHDILNDVQLLAGNNAVKAATKEQTQKLLEAMQELSEMSPSLREEGPPGYKISGPGPKNIHTGGGSQYNNMGRATVNTYHADSMNFGAIPNSFNESREDYIAHHVLSTLLLTRPESIRANLISQEGDRVDGTCEWLHTNSEYLEWQRSPKSDALWISGGPGKGKTMLAIYSTQYLERIASNDGIVLYFFCHSSDRKRNTAVSILRGLLYQLLEQQGQLAGAVHDYFNIPKKALDTISSIESLWRVFDILVQKLDGPIYCVLDGLDECDEKSLNILLKKFRCLLSRTEQDPRPQRFKLLVLCRDWPPSIQRQLNKFRRLNLDLTAEALCDVERFIAAKVNELDDQSQDIQFSEAGLEKVTHRLKEGADGTFLWVAFVADELMDKTEEQAEKILQAVPNGLRGIYLRMLQQIRIDEEIAAAILPWVVLACEPLSVAELAAATGVECSATQTSEQIMMDRVRLCGRLLRVDDGVVRLVHQSVKDYLLEDAPYNRDFEVYRIKATEGHLALANICLHLIAEVCFKDYGGYGEHEHFVKLEGYPLAEYAISYWLDHTMLASERPSTPALKAAFYVSHYLMRTKSILWWAYHPGAYTLLHISVRLHITPLVRYLLKNTRRYDLEMEDAFGRRPLSRAAQQGQREIVKLLLDSEANVNARDTSGFDMTPLHWAARSGHEDVVALLLERGASVNAIAMGDRNPLGWVIENGSNDVLRLLLAKNPKLNYSYKSFCKQTSHLQNLQLLSPMRITGALSVRRAFVELMGCLLWKPHPLFSIAMLLMLLVSRIPLDQLLSLRMVQAALSANCTYGGLASSTAFCLRGYRRTPLLQGVELQNGDAVQSLLRQGADPNFRPGGMPTPLALARKLDDARIVKLLEDHGAVVGSTQDSYFWSPTKSEIKGYYLFEAMFVLFCLADIGAVAVIYSGTFLWGTLISWL